MFFPLPGDATDRFFRRSLTDRSCDQEVFLHLRPQKYKRPEGLLRETKTHTHRHMHTWPCFKINGIPFWGFRCTTHFRTCFSGEPHAPGASNVKPSPPNLVQSANGWVLVLFQLSNGPSFKPPDFTTSMSKMQFMNQPIASLEAASPGNATYSLSDWCQPMPIVEVEKPEATRFVLVGCHPNSNRSCFYLQ